MYRTTFCVLTYPQPGKSQPVRGVRLVLGFDIGGIPPSGGTTQPVYTDANGLATVEHAHKGTATIYLDGKNITTRIVPPHSKGQVINVLYQR
jgi:hypothetical protein